MNKKYLADISAFESLCSGNTARQRSVADPFADTRAKAKEVSVNNVDLSLAALAEMSKNSLLGDLIDVLEYFGSYDMADKALSSFRVSSIPEVCKALIYGLGGMRSVNHAKEAMNRGEEATGYGSPGTDGPAIRLGNDTAATGYGSPEGTEGDIIDAEYTEVPSQKDAGETPAPTGSASTAGAPRRPWWKNDKEMRKIFDKVNRRIARRDTKPAGKTQPGWDNASEDERRLRSGLSHFYSLPKRDREKLLRRG